MSTNPGAQSIVLSTAEILESILLELDLETLLTAAQQTCRAWKYVIDASPSLQKALFFSPIEDTEGHKEKIRNPLLVGRFPPFFTKPNREDMFALEPRSFMSCLDMIKRRYKFEAYVRPEASWRHMLVQQPPVSVLANFEASYRPEEYYNYYEISVSTFYLAMQLINEDR